MSKISYRGVDVDFPFQPYECQKEFIHKVLDALIDRKHALLESPTGTGKTLCCLCATLAWQRTQLGGGPKCDLDKAWDDEPVRKQDNKKIDNQILYLSRTHSQLKQVVAEVRRSGYVSKQMGTMMAVVGGRDHLCVNRNAKRESGRALDTECKRLIRNRGCIFHGRLSSFNVEYLHEPMDLEDLCRVGTGSKMFCPFYAVRESHPKCNIVLMPYNYVFDATLRDVLGLSLENAVVILDEGHNTERVAEDSMSFDVRLSELDYSSLASREIASRMTSKKEGALTGTDVINKLSRPLDTLIECLRGMSQDTRSTYNGEDLIKVFKDNWCTAAAIDACTSWAEEFEGTDDELKDARQWAGSLQSLKRIFDLCEMAKSGLSWYRGYIDRTQDTDPCVSLWCFTGSVAFSDISGAGARSVILTSGTLAPMETLKFALETEKLKFDIVLENSHVVDPKRVFSRIVGTSEFCFTYERRGNVDMFLRFGELLLSICDATPGGLLIFFPSYPVLRTATEAWKSCDMFDRLLERKRIFVEASKATENAEVVRSFIRSVNRKDSMQGAMLLAVCRGKISEGLDFPDKCCRSVVVVGIPFPAVKDPRVATRLDVIRQESKRDTSTWFSEQAMRAVNQAIGRAIRHVHDYGAIFLVDTRYREQRTRSRLSRWVRDEIMDIQPENVAGALKGFFTHIEPTITFPEKCRKSIAPAAMDVFGSNFGTSKAMKPKAAAKPPPPPSKTLDQFFGKKMNLPARGVSIPKPSSTDVRVPRSIPNIKSSPTDIKGPSNPKDISNLNVPSNSTKIPNLTKVDDKATDNIPKGKEDVRMAVQALNSSLPKEDYDQLKTYLAQANGVVGERHVLPDIYRLLSTHNGGEAHFSKIVELFISRENHGFAELLKKPVMSQKVTIRRRDLITGAVKRPPPVGGVSVPEKRGRVEVIEEENPTAKIQPEENPTAKIQPEENPTAKIQPEETVTEKIEPRENSTEKIEPEETIKEEKRDVEPEGVEVVDVEGENERQSGNVGLGGECVICSCPKPLFVSAACKHSACMDCWNTILSSKLECPFCRERVRLKFLYPLKK